jgi:GTPase SAR1 family protein
LELFINYIDRKQLEVDGRAVVLDILDTGNTFCQFYGWKNKLTFCVFLTAGQEEYNAMRGMYFDDHIIHI